MECLAARIRRINPRAFVVACRLALDEAVAWGSLCILSFEARKHWGSRVAVSLPRANGRMTTSDRQSHRIAHKIRRRICQNASGTTCLAGSTLRSMSVRTYDD